MDFIKQVQFNVTKEVASNSEWKEKQIVARNDNLAKRACKAVLAPLERTKPLMTVEFENGFYPASDITTDMNGSEVKDVLFKNESLGINSWRY